MSYQSAIHFDPTALLIIKNEIDNTIKLVESAVSTLLEDQQLPFGIDDALLQLQQSAKILKLIDLPLLAQITQYSAELMHNIMQHPTQVQSAEAEYLSEGLAVLKRYVEFSCLQQVMIPQFLLETLNHLELALKKPLTREGQQICTLLDCIDPQISLVKVSEPTPSQSVYALYKMCVLHACTQKLSKLDFVGFQLVGQHLAFLAQQTPHQHFWALVNLAFEHLDQSYITQPRLRVLIQIERQIAQFLTQPETFHVSKEAQADIITLCLSQDHSEAEKLRHQLNLNDDLLSDNQLHLYYKKLYEPDQDTMQTACTLLSDEISALHKEIEFNYLTLSDDRFEHIKHQLIAMSHTLNILNLTQTADQLQQPLAQLKNARSLTEEHLVQMLMNSLLQALNDLGLLARQHQPDLLQYHLNNTEIALDRLDNAHQTLAIELKAVVDLTSQSLLNYVQTQNFQALENLANAYKEMSGALLFMLENNQAATAFSNCSKFIEQQVAQQQQLKIDQVQYLLNVCASADMLLESRTNQHPVMQRMFDIALQHSQKLYDAA